MSFRGGVGLTSPELLLSLFKISAIEKFVILFLESELFVVTEWLFKFLTILDSEVTNEVTALGDDTKLCRWADWAVLAGVTAAAETAKFVEIIKLISDFFERSLLMFRPQLVGNIL